MSEVTRILSHVELVQESRIEQVLALDEALERFSILEPTKAELVELRYFVALIEEEAAATSAACVQVRRPTMFQWRGFR